MNSAVRNMLTKLKVEGTTKKGVFKIKNIKTMLGPITKACTSSSNLFNLVDLQMYLNFES